MDTLIQSYLEETEDMLQRAEECIMRLEIEYSSIDVNELFRIAHTIKGSSQMVGYEDVGNIMHKVEDMLDCARNGSIMFDQTIISLCFEGLDIVKKMLQYKNEQDSQEIMDSIDNAASKINEMIEAFIRDNKKEDEKTVIEKPKIGIVSSLLSKNPKGQNKYYITFFFEEDAPMVSPVVIMILNGVDDIGRLIYSSVNDNYFSESSGDKDIKTFDIIISTDIDEAELYTYFTLFYIEKINIVNLSRCKVEENDYSFTDDENNVYLIVMKAFINIYKIVFSRSKQLKINKKDIGIIKSLYCEAVNTFDKMKNKNKTITFITDFNEIYNNIIKMNNQKCESKEERFSIIKEQMGNMMERAYNHTKGKYIFSVFKSGEDDFINRLRNFIEMLNKSSTLILFIDLSRLTMLHENEVNYLIDIKKQMKSHNIEMGIIVDIANARRTINIFDSISQVEEFHVFGSELDALLGLFHSDDCFERISKRLTEVQYIE